MLPALGGAAAIAAGAISRWDAASGILLVAVAAGLAAKYARSPKMIAVACLAVLLLTFYGYTASMPPDTASIPFRQQMRWRGLVIDDPVPTENGYRMPVMLEASAPASPEGGWRPASGAVLLSVEGEFIHPPARGDRTVFRSALSPLSTRRNPGSLRNELYTARKRIIGRAYADLDSTAVFASPDRGADPLASWRSKVSETIAAAWPGPAGAAVSAITVGDRSGIDRDLYDLFRNSGTVHLLSVSGLHLGILLLMGAAAARFFLVRAPALALAYPVEPAAKLAALAPVFLYAFISGLSVATLRSLIMTSVVALAGFLGRRTSLGGLLAATALALIIINPLSAADPGFQLSFAAIAGLFWFPGLLSKNSGEGQKESGKNPVSASGRFLRGLLAASIAATLATAPIAAFHFGRGGWAGIAYNCIAVPVTGFVVLPAALGGVLLNPVSGWLSSLLFKLAGFSMEILIAAMKPLPDWEPFFLSAPFSSAWGVAGFFAVLAALAARKKEAAVRLSLLAAGISLLVLPPVYTFARGLLENEVNMWALDVGDGQAIVFEMPGGKWVLLDGGGIPGSTADIGRSVTWPALRALGCHRLHMVISSHSHPDHVGGLVFPVLEGKPEKIILPELFRGDPAYAPLLSAGREAGSEEVWVSPCVTKPLSEKFGEAELTVYGAAGKTPNEKGLMAMVRIGATGIFIPSDVEAPEQARLIGEGFNPGKADVLVAPHHGSADAVHEPFIRLLGPSLTVVSCGDRRGWPSGELLRVLSLGGSEVAATSATGAFHVRAYQHGFEGRPYSESALDGRR